jgi:hypothetical protein
MIPAEDLLAQPLSSWVGGRPGRQALTTLATAVTSNSWPVSISRQRGLARVGGRARLPYPVVVRVVNGGSDLRRVSASAWAVLSAQANLAFIPTPTPGIAHHRSRHLRHRALAAHGSDVATDRFWATQRVATMAI